MTNPLNWSMRKRPLTAMATAVSLPLFITSPGFAEENPFKQFPIVITCKSKDTYHAFYFSRLAQDDVATYVASERIAGRISLDGHAVAVGSDGGGSCVGKTLDELRASGQAHDLPLGNTP